MLQITAIRTLCIIFTGGFLYLSLLYLFDREESRYLKRRRRISQKRQDRKSKWIIRIYLFILFIGVPLCFLFIKYWILSTA